jgi:hypothetical protein
VEAEQATTVRAEYYQAVEVEEAEVEAEQATTVRARYY